MDFKVVWTEPALEDLREIVSHISLENPTAAERTGNGIIDRVETLSQFPLIGPKYPRGSRGQIREIVCGNYRVFYRALRRKRLIEILAVWHSDRDEPNLGR